MVIFYNAKRQKRGTRRRVPRCIKGLDSVKGTSRCRPALSFG